jgi:Flp pilus assembly protein TadG
MNLTTRPRMRLSLRSERGQTLVETALILPLILLILFGIVEFGRAFNYWNDLNQMAGDGARFAAVNRNPCPSGNLNDCIKAQADATSLKNDSTVCIAIANNNVGSPVQVKTAYTFNLLPILGDLPLVGNATVDLKGSATMRLEAAASSTKMSWSASCS